MMSRVHSWTHPRNHPGGWLPAVPTWHPPEVGAGVGTRTQLSVFCNHEYACLRQFTCSQADLQMTILISYRRGLMAALNA